MALIKCHECGKKVSTESATCPACGATVRIPVTKQKSSSGKPVSKLLLILLGIFIVLPILNTFLAKDKTPEELKQEAEARASSLAQKAEEDKKLSIATKRAEAAAVIALRIKKSARNPDSVSWEYILTNDDASLVCIELRAENGYGGMSIENIVTVSGQIKTSDSAWNKHCANKELHDVKAKVIRLLKIYE